MTRLPALLPLALLALTGCAAGSKASRPSAPSGPVVQYEMEEMKIEAVSGPDGLQIDSYDASGLFEQAGAALSAGKLDEAVRLYDKLLVSFGDSSFARPAMYNRGLALRDKKDWQAAIDAFKGMVEKYGDHPDAKDALFQMGACYAEQTNWPASAEVFARLLERKDLNADDHIEALARRGFAQFNLKDLDTAEKTFRSVLMYKRTIENQERLGTDFYLAFSQYHLGQIVHERFRAVELRLPEAQMDRDLDQKASLLLKAQYAYIDTIKYGNPAWASAAGFQVGSLYEELYDAFMRAPVPPALTTEARRVYLEELHKKIRILLEKSIRWQRENLLMIERLGVNTDWAEKSKVAYGKLLKLLDPAAKPDFGSGQTPEAPVAPPTPSPPERSGNGPTDKPANDDDMKRQIL